MNPFLAAAIIALLLIVRIALPLAVVGGLCYSLDCLFRRWDKEAQMQQPALGTD